MPRGAHLVSQEPCKPQIRAACASFRPLSTASMMTCAKFTGLYRSSHAALENRNTFKEIREANTTEELTFSILQSSLDTHTTPATSAATPVVHGKGHQFQNARQLPASFSLRADITRKEKTIEYRCLPGALFQ